MADEDDLGLDEGGADDVGGGAQKKKGGAVGGIVQLILKWAAIVLGGIILIVTVVIITMKIAGGNQTQQQVIPASEEYSGSRELLDWFQAVGTVRTKTNEENPASVTVEVALGYKKDDKSTATELSQRIIELKDFLRRYFTGKTADELKPYNEENLKIEIRNAINDSILSTSKIKDVKFLTLDVVQN